MVFVRNSTRSQGGQTFKDSGSKHYTRYGFWNQNPKMSSILTFGKGETAFVWDFSPGACFGFCQQPRGLCVEAGETSCSLALKSCEEVSCCGSQCSGFQFPAQREVPVLRLNDTRFPCLRAACCHKERFQEEGM